MFISRTPLRISSVAVGPTCQLTTGITVGVLVAAAIDKYIHVAINDPSRIDTSSKYSQMENVASAADIQHPLIREVALYRHSTWNRNQFGGRSTCGYRARIFWNICSRPTESVAST